jgi:hypothetical protein
MKTLFPSTEIVIVIINKEYKPYFDITGQRATESRKQKEILVQAQRTKLNYCFSRKINISNLNLFSNKKNHL